MTVRSTRKTSLFVLAVVLAACGEDRPLAQELRAAPSIESAPPSCPAITVQDDALWVWQTSAITDPVEAAALRSYAGAHHVRRFFALAQRVVEGPPQTQHALVDFIREAHAACIDVDLLFGETEWTFPGEGQDTAIEQVRATLRFIEQHPEARPDGVHFDVEPYTTEVWTSDRQGTIDAYVDLLDRLRAITSEHHLRLSVDLPFWFHGETCTHAGVTRPLDELVVARVDRIVIMSYRDFAGVDHDNGIIDVASEEVRAASAAGREAIVGVETDFHTPDAQNFWNEGRLAMQRELDAVRSWFGSHEGFSGYRGNAIHDWHYGAQLPDVPTPAVQPGP